MQRRGYTAEEIARFWAATGCASFARRGILKIPLTLGTVEGVVTLTSV